MKTKLFALLLALTMSPTTSALTLAQNSGSGQIITQDQAQAWLRVQALVHGTELIVETKSGDTVEGVLNSVTSTALSLSDNGNLVDLNQSDIRRVYLAKNRSRGKAAKLGAIIGAAGGGGLGLAFAVKAGKEGDPTPAPLVWGIYGAGIGAGIGALLGGGKGKGRLIYEAK